MRPLPRKSGVRISMRMFGLAWRAARMQAAKCSAPPSRRSSRSTEVITTYFRRMSRIVSASRAGSSGSGATGRPCATSQNEQRRVQTSPRIMKVAVPLLKHSWMFGQDASSQTVTSEFSRRRAFSCCTALPCGRRTRIHDGLRRVGHAGVETGAVQRDLVVAELLFDRRRSADDGDRDDPGGGSGGFAHVDSSDRCASGEFG